MMNCSLCGFQFDENEAQTACRTCPVVKGCKLIRCPNCGFETPQEPKWAKKVPAKFFAWFTPTRSVGVRDAESMRDSRPLSLADLTIGQEIEIVSIQTHDSNKLRMFMAMGVFPGKKITLIQKFPSYTFQMGHAQFVVDRELAESILCRPNPVEASR